MSLYQEVCILYLKVSKYRPELFELRHSRSELRAPGAILRSIQMVCTRMKGIYSMQGS